MNEWLMQPWRMYWAGFTSCAIIWLIHHFYSPIHKSGGFGQNNNISPLDTSKSNALSGNAE